MLTDRHVCLVELCIHFGTPRWIAIALLVPSLVVFLLRDGARYVRVACRDSGGPIGWGQCWAGMVGDHAVLRAVRWSLSLTRRMHIKLER